jgi:DNA-binding transcriptional LysR family regulator
MAAAPHEDSYRHPWLGVEVRDLAALVAVARAGSFRQAAAELGCVQSAISQQVARLEGAVGARLVDRRRGHRAIALTPAGRALCTHGAAIVAQLRAARADLEAAPGTLRVALAGDGEARLLGDALPAVLDALPGLRVHVLEPCGDAALAAAIEGGDADVAIGAPPSAGPVLVRVPLSDDSFVALVPAGSPLAHRPAVTGVGELAGETLLVAGACTPAGHDGPTLRVPWSAAVPALVVAGTGVGLTPRSEAGGGGSGVVAVPVAPGLAAPRRVAVCWDAARRRTAVIERFAAVVAEGSARPTLARAA